MPKLEIELNCEKAKRTILLFCCCCCCWAFVDFYGYCISLAYMVWRLFFPILFPLLFLSLLCIAFWLAIAQCVYAPEYISFIVNENDVREKFSRNQRKPQQTWMHNRKVCFLFGHKIWYKNPEMDRIPSTHKHKSKTEKKMNSSKRKMYCGQYLTRKIMKDMCAIYDTNTEKWKFRLWRSVRERERQKEILWTLQSHTHTLDGGNGSIFYLKSSHWIWMKNDKNCFQCKTILASKPFIETIQ